MKSVSLNHLIYTLKINQCDFTRETGVVSLCQLAAGSVLSHFASFISLPLDNVCGSGR